MTTVTVQGTVLDAADNPVPFAAVHVTLVTSNPSTPGYTGSGEITATYQASASQTGAWSLALTPNSLITPANTYYQVTEGSGAVSNIVVAASGGPYQIEQVLATPPPTPAAPGITGVQVAVAGTVTGVRPEINLTGAGGATITGADNTTATFLRSAPTTAVTNGTAANQASAFPLPATANAANGSGTVYWIATP